MAKKAKKAMKKRKKATKKKVAKKTAKKTIKKMAKKTTRKKATKNTAKKASRKTKTAGATKAGRGKYYFPFAKLKKVPAGTGYSTSHGGVVEGERMLIGYIRKPKGTGSRMHSHPNEQAGIGLEGEFEFTIGEEKKMVKKGELYLIPGGIEHRVLTGNQPSKALDIFSPPREDYKKGLT